MFAEAPEDGNGFPVHEPEIRSSGNDRRRRYGIHELIIGSRCNPFEKAGIFRRFPYGLDDIISFLPPGYQRRNQGRWMLHVSIHRDDGISTGKIHSAGKCNLMTEIPCQRNSPDVRIGSCQPADFLFGPIAGSIVDIYQFIIHSHSPFQGMKLSEIREFFFPVPIV